MNKVIRNGLLGAALVSGVGYVNGSNFDVDPNMFGDDVKIIDQETNVPENQLKGELKAFSEASELIKQQQKKEEEEAENLRKQEEEEEEELLAATTFADYMKKGAENEEWYKEPVELKAEMSLVKVVKDMNEVELAKTYEYKNKVATLISELLFKTSKAGETADLKSDDVVNKMAKQVPSFVKVLENDMVNAYVNLSEEVINDVVAAFMAGQKLSYKSDAAAVCKTFAADAQYDAEGKLTVNKVDGKANLLEIANKSLKKCFNGIDTSGLELKDYTELLWGVNDLEGVKFCFSEDVKCSALPEAVKKGVEKDVQDKKKVAIENTKKILADETGSQLTAVFKDLINKGATSGELTLIYNDVVKNLRTVKEKEEIAGYIQKIVAQYVTEKKEEQPVKKTIRTKPGSRPATEKPLHQDNNIIPGSKTIKRADYNKLGPSAQKKLIKQGVKVID